MAYSLEEMEKYLSEIFAEAKKDLIKKAADYMADFAVRDMAKAQKVENGELSDEEYREWRKNKLLYGQHWTRLIQDVQKEMANVNQTALDYINDKTTKIFADSYNSIESVIKSSPVEGYSFELVDANTVKNIAKQEGIMLPPKKNLDKQKDKLWNAKLVNAQLLQGILQGESVPKIAARMGNVCESNKAASIRNARTMVTAAENSGRQSGMNKAEQDGIIFKKIWIATADERTRPTHIALNGAMVDNDEKFVTFNGDEIEFPGDWAAEPSEVWNCRCALGTKVTGFDKNKLHESIERQKQLEHQTVEEQTEEAIAEEHEIIFEGQTSQVEPPRFVEEPKEISPVLKKVINALERRDVDYVPVQYHTVQPTESEIIQKLSGGDMTRGSCASLSLAFIGQTLGLDVLDYRGGDSMEYFADPVKLRVMSTFNGVVAYYDKGKSTTDQALNLLNNCENGKMYMLAIAEHAAIVRKTEKGKLEFLELQGKMKMSNKWRSLTKGKLEGRFGTTSDSVQEYKLGNHFMINITDSNFGDDFKYALGYINTAEDMQQKGKRGGKK